ncbi:MAG TPA: hypothetical protein PKW90_00405 [Myxococcota bacterium]|nr:hypothetical protein [Myxococcota bacterium]
MRSTDTMGPRLSTLSRDQLVALVERLVARHPDLEDLVNLPLPGEARRADAASVHAQVTRILRNMGDDWRASWRAQYELFPIVAIGDGYRQQGLLEDARIVYRAVIDAILALYERIRDEESEISGVVGDCVEGLGACFDATTEPRMREELLRDLFQVYCWDTLDHGGYGMSGPAEKVLLTCGSPEERWLVARWFREVLTGPLRSNHGRRAAGALVLRLVGDLQDPAEREAIYREAKMDLDLLDLLLKQGREEEALGLLLVPDADLLRLADRLVAAGLRERTVAMVNAHPAVLDHQSDPVRDWLSRQGVPGMQEVDALAWKLHSFVRTGNVGHWDALRAAAESLGRLEQVLPQAIAAVQTERTGYQAAGARVLALAGRFDEAEVVLARLPEASWRRAALAVAAAAESVRPALAQTLYGRAADDLRKRGTKPAREELAEILRRLAVLDRACCI